MALRVGIIGCGRMAGTIDDEIKDSHPDFILPYGHVNGYARVPATQVVAAADVAPEKLRAWCDRFGVPARYGDYNEMLAQERLDIVSVTTPAHARAAPILAAVAAGVRGIYAEKALCVSHAELDAIATACRETGVHLVSGAMRRYWAGFETARRFLDAGELGAPKALLIGAANGVAFHTHSHMIDAALYLLGDPEPVAVSARLQGRKGELAVAEERGALRTAEDPCIRWATVELDNGTRLACTDLPSLDVEVVCERGTLRSWGDSSGYTAWRSASRYARQAVPFPGWQARSGTVAIIEDLVASLATGRPGRSHVEVLRRGMEILLGMVLSHHRGGAEVALPARDRVVHVMSH